MIKKLLIFTVLYFAHIPVFAQYVDTSWVRRYNPVNGSDEAQAITVDDAGNVYVTGRSYMGVATATDYATIKYYPNGDTAWLRTYSGPGAGYDAAYAITVDASGDVYVTGYCDQDTSSSVVNDDYVTVKYDSDGTQLWVRTYNGPANGWDEASAIALDSSGNIYITGSSSSSGQQGWDYATIKYSPGGDQLWVRRYAGPAGLQDWAKDIVIDGSNSVFVTGYSGGSGGYSDYATVKYDASGNEQWVRRYNYANLEDDAYAIALDSSNNVYVTGRSFASGTLCDCATVKYNSNGNELWVRRYRGPANTSASGNDIATDGSENIYVVGSASASGTGIDYVTLKYDPEGNQLWARTYTDPGYGLDYAFALGLDVFGNVYVTGMKNYNIDPPSGDYATLKYDPNGNQVWVRTYNGSGNSVDWVKAIAVDRFNNVCITGRCTDSGDYYEYTTIKYYQNYSPSVTAPDSSKFLCVPDTIKFTVLATDPNGDDTLTLSGPGIATPLRGLSPLSAEAKNYIPSAGTYNYIYTVTDSRNVSDNDTSTYVTTFNNPPVSFSLISPQDSALVPYGIDFNWETATDPDPLDQVKYDLYVSTSSVFQVDSTVIYDSISTSAYTDSLDRGTYYWKVKAYDTCTGKWSNQSWVVFSGICGDVNGDRVVDVGDVVYMVNYLFKSGTAPNPLKTGNVNSDGAVDVGDVVYLINYLFKGGLAPCG